MDASSYLASMYARPPPDYHGQLQWKGGLSETWKPPAQPQQQTLLGTTPDLPLWLALPPQRWEGEKHL